MIAALVTNIWPFLAGLAIVVAGYFFGRTRGVQTERTRQAVDDAQAGRTAREIEHDVNNLDETELRDRAIARGWLRNSKR